MLLVCIWVKTLGSGTCLISMRIVAQHPLLGSTIRTLYSERYILCINSYLELRIHNVPDLRVEDEGNFVIYLRGRNCQADYRWNSIVVPTYKRDDLVRDIISGLDKALARISGHHTQTVLKIPLEV